MVKNKFQIVSYYTINTKYEEEAVRLGRSMGKFKIPGLIQGVPNHRSWMKNTHYKAMFILRWLDHEDEYDSIVWTDADSIFHRYPILFEEIREDVGIHYRNWRHAQNEVLSGTIFLRRNNRVKEMVNEWIYFNKKNRNKWEQKNLERALKRSPMLKIHKLPIEYCTIFDDDRRGVLDPVVEHFQASRRLRWEVDHGSS